MMDNGPVTSKMINRNWVSKHRRRKLSYDPDTSKGNKTNSGANASSKHELKNEITSDRVSKMKGDDGYFYECVICDLGGDLLCCDSCPQVYHLECLDPPLKRIPNGMWQCPTCCLKSDLHNDTKKSDPVLKRARKTIAHGKPGSKIKLVRSDKVSEKFVSSTIGKRPSVDKGKSLSPCVSQEDSSSFVKVDNEKKSIGDFSQSGIVNSKRNEETCVRNSDGSHCSGSPTQKIVHVLDAGVQKARKRKHNKVYVGDDQKKSRTNKNKCAGDTSRKCRPKENSASPQTSKPPQKHKKVKHGSSPSPLKSDTRTEMDISLKDEVDRVLGCRVQAIETDTSHHTTVTNSNNPPPKESMFSDNLNTVSGENSGGDVTILDGGATRNSTKVRPDILNNADVEKAMDSLKSDIKVSDSTVVNGKNKGTSAVSAEGLAKAAGKLLTEENTEGSKEFEVSILPKKTNHTREKRTKAPISPESVSPNGGLNATYEFLVKWVGKSHLHNSWISESQMKVIAKRKLENYKGKYGTAVIDICEEQWKQPQRIISLHSSTDGSSEVLVKWTALPYDECTWERLDEPVITKSSRIIDLFNRFERQTVDKDATKDYTPRGKSDEVAPLTKQPKELVGGDLFPHQLEALNWLRKCWYKGRNVILADEMGLGKTVSAISFLSSLYFEFKARHPCLVLVPLSTMPNWMAEFTLWAPDLNVVEYHGSAKARAMIRQYEWHANAGGPNGSGHKTGSYKFNVILTTYEMVLADSPHLRGIPWEVLVVDEGHRLKNSSSKLFGLLNTYSFQHRVLLTGTPLQNNIGEMYNLLNFLQPSSFPSLSSFEEKFNDFTTAEKVEELKKLVAPHMLRRLKKDAMQNIPPKIERMVPVELSSIQAEYYRAMLTKNYQILRNIGKGVAQQSMRNIVMQLRKVCNHPYLIQGTEPESGSVDFLHEMRIKASAKLTLLHSMLKILHKEGHRVLIFSQMTKLLDILEDYLNIEFGSGTFERVDGSVSISDRQTAITRFNQDKTRFVFLLSTRSCGLGINLATADTVIIYDSDFNPHADIQAMNRAHRIGQSSRLLVYRLVVRASVEERILQLAKRKLMLDQLFVNKSGSQKEVEDIIRWGTEQLFNDDSGEDQGNKVEGVAGIETNRRRRSGGLGDVYEDKCTGGSSKIVWDENTVMKLLDRSNLQSNAVDNADGDSENDMLGSVKPVEWNDEPAEEQQKGSESLPVETDETYAQHNWGKKEDTLAAAFSGENEWDRLLRVRWEKYQIEEEAALGRGKRLRKAVFYKEAYALNPTRTSNEGGADEEPEPELEREYTSAGRAHKAKFVKLRSRQKERLAQRNKVYSSGQMEGLPGLEPPFLPLSSTPDKKQITRSDQPGGKDSSSAIDLEEDNKQSQSIEAPKTKTDHKMKSHLDFPFIPFGNHSPEAEIALLDQQHLQGTSYTNSLSNNLLPVLGLCAPNANQKESSEKNIAKSQSKKSKKGSRRGLPFDLAPLCSLNEADDKPPGPKDMIHDNYLPHSLPFPPEKSSDNVETSGPSFSNFQEKLALPKLPFERKLLPKFPFPTPKLPHPCPDLFPTLTLRSTAGDVNNASVQNLPKMPLLPNLKFPHEDALRNGQQGLEVGPPVLGLGLMLPTCPSLPENHRKVLENIMMRTGKGPNSNLVKRKSMKDSIWSEDELDYLWIGVRRHGRGNWDTMLRNPKLRFSKFKTVQDLSARWQEEQLKIFDPPALPVQKRFKPSKSSKSAKSSLFPDISDAVMTRALHGSRFADPPKFQSHLMDIKFGFGDLPSGQLGLCNEHFSPIPTWNSDNQRPIFPEPSSAGPSNRPGPSNIQMEQPFLLNTLGDSSLGSRGLNCSSSLDLQQEDEQRASRRFNFPTFFDKSLNFLREIDNDSNKGKSGSHCKGKDVAESSSSKNKLPHWLQDAVGSPPKPNPALPPAVLAIAQSVRLLYGDDNPTIPPFVAPGQPPLLPKDPRQRLKKKKKQRVHTFQPFPQGIAGPSHHFQSIPLAESVCSTLPLLGPPPFPVIPRSTSAGTSGLPRMEPNLNMLSPSLNMLNPSSVSVYSNSQKKRNAGMSPSPEVLQLVASCVAPGSLGPSSSVPESKLPLPNSVDQVMLPVSKETCGEQMGKQSSQGGKLDSQIQEKSEQIISEDSSKTRSDRPDRSDLKEVSSEGTVSE